MGFQELFTPERTGQGWGDGEGGQLGGGDSSNSGNKDKNVDNKNPQIIASRVGLEKKNPGGIKTQGPSHSNWGDLRGRTRAGCMRTNMVSGKGKKDTAGTLLKQGS